MPSWIETAKEVFGTEVDEVLLYSAKVLSAFRKRATKTPGGDLVRKRIPFYLSRGYPDHPGRFFSLPKTPPPQVRVVEERPFCDGSFRLYAFPSRYTVRNPDVRESFESFRENRTVYLAHWSHGDRGRKTILCCHGWSLGDPGQAQRMFRVPRLYNLGLDVALFVTPFHGRRADSLAQRLSPPFPFQDPVLGLEGFGQAMHDLASSFRLLSDRGASRIGIVGASLGGYLAALFVSLTPMAETACLLVPLVSFHGIKLPVPFHPDSEQDNRLQQEVASLWRIHSPLSHRCRLSPEHCLIIAAKGDRLCPFEDVQRLHEHWGRPEHAFLRGGHVFFFPKRARGKTWYQFLRKHRFIGERHAPRMQGPQEPPG